MENALQIRCCTAALLATGLLVCNHALPQPQRWPSKPVRIIVPFSPGGGTDIQARVLSAVFHDVTGQPFPADNRADVRRD